MNKVGKKRRNIKKEDYKQKGSINKGGIYTQKEYEQRRNIIKGRI